MNLFPAIQAQIGSWNYYMVKMSMREISENVSFATEINDDHTLDDAIQRTLDESRATKQIANYLIKQPDRFFSSIVIAAIGGSPQWYPVEMTDDPRFAIFRGDSHLNNAFGIITFSPDRKYYALDGQHRLKAIKALTDPKSDLANEAPQGFRDEEVSVIIVVPNSAETREDFMRKYRRLFGHLNRYAKAMDQVTNIIMDEDDAFAIITRRLISEHHFFKWTGRQRESARVKTKKGKNLTSSDSWFISLEGLYDLNQTLLTSARRKNFGWDDEGTMSKDFTRMRPSDEILEALYDELVIYWDVLLEVLPQLKNHPSTMRDHNASKDSKTEDSLLFWPIGQDIAGSIIRRLIDINFDSQEKLTRESLKGALSPMASLDWDMKSPPSRHILLIPDNKEHTVWKIRSDDRAGAARIVERIFNWQLGIDELNGDEVSDLRADWERFLLPALQESLVQDLWMMIESRVR